MGGLVLSNECQLIDNQLRVIEPSSCEVRRLERLQCLCIELGLQLLKDMRKLCKAIGKIFVRLVFDVATEIKRRDARKARMVFALARFTGAARATRDIERA